MSNNNAPHISADREIDDLINNAVIKFKNNESIESDLLKINGDGDKFNEWAWGIELGVNADLKLTHFGLKTPIQI